MLLMPPSLDDWVAAEHPVRFVRDFVESLDLVSLGFESSEAHETGRPHYSPEMLLGVWLFGWMERTRSSRALEKACLRDVAYMWLTGNHRPDHNTLWRFFRNNKEALRNLFKQVVRMAADVGLVGFALHAIDGTKLAAASSMETALHRKSLDEQLKKLDELVRVEMAKVESAEEVQEPSWAMPENLRDPEKRRKRIVELMQQREQLEAAGTAHLHPAEVDARAMKGRKHTVLGYNAQAVVDHDSELIVAADVTGEQTDHSQLVPMIEQVIENAGRTAEQTVADAGYCSGEQLDKAERRGLSVIVHEQGRDGKGDFSKSRFDYDAKQDGFTCPRGQFLPLQTVRNRGTEKQVAQYRCHNLECPALAQCTKDPKGRTIKTTAYEAALQHQREKRSVPAMAILLSLRKEIVELTFALLKSIDGFRQFTVRGLDGVRAQWALACTAANLRKLHRHRRVLLEQAI